jgi:hypothetical protein
MQRFAYVRLYADADGESHFEDVELSLTPSDYSPPTPPLNVAVLGPAQQFALVGAPAGWWGDWHRVPRRQFYCTLKGEVEVEASGGSRRRFPIGCVLLAEDTAGKGHISRVIGDEDVVVAVTAVVG